jgi:hypothetical protein
MLDPQKYQLLYSREGMGSSVYGWSGVRIEVQGRDLPTYHDRTTDLEWPEILRKASYDAAKLIEDALEEVLARQNQAFMDGCAQAKANLLSLFPAPFYYEEVPNQYEGGSWYGRLNPWLKVYLPTYGPILIGWRKRVIQLDWSESLIQADGYELFASEDVTKGISSIHCWSLDKARDYLNRLFEHHSKSPPLQVSKS